MRYLLVLGFICNVYRRKPRARIFVDDNLIDDLHISQQPDNDVILKKFLEKFHPLQPYSKLEYHSKRIKSLPALKFYELEVDKKIKDLTVRINIDNSDSNYTNGFMTNSTLIKLKTCLFFPLDDKLLLRFQKIYNKNRFSKNYVWYLAYKNEYFDLAKNGMSWRNKEKKFSSPYLDNHWIGGNGDFICNLEKKYGIFVSKTLKSYRHSYASWKINYLVDKYQQYANQRNNG